MGRFPRTPPARRTRTQLLPILRWRLFEGCLGVWFYSWPETLVSFMWTKPSVPAEWLSSEGSDLTAVTVRRPVGVSSESRTKRFRQLSDPHFGDAGQN